jgi:hypothetical protein
MGPVTLYEFRDAKISIHIWAEIEEGRLVISGQDLDIEGDEVSSFWGDSEYEYYYYLSPEDTQKLYKYLQEETKLEGEPIQLIQHYFAGTDTCARFRDYCEVHGLKAMFFSW